MSVNDGLTQTDTSDQRTPAALPGAMSHAARVAELIDRLGRMTRELQYVDGLNPAQWEALRYLNRANRYSRTPGGVAEFLGATKGTISQTVSALESKGLIARTPSDRDKRVCLIDLTEEGQRMIARDPVRCIETIVGGMDEATAAQMVSGLGRLMASLQIELGSKPFGVCAACCRHLAPESGCKKSEATPKCGMTGEPLQGDAPQRICVNYLNDAAE